MGSQSETIEGWQRLARYEYQINRTYEEYTLACKEYVNLSRKLEAAILERECTKLAQAAFQYVAQSIQKEVHKRIAGVVTRCLALVFDDPYEFNIQFDRKRGRTEAVFQFIRGGVTLENPLREVGGGVIDVAAFALRLSALLLSRPPLTRVLVLDEPFSKIRGIENRERVRSMVMQLSEELGVQFIINIDIDAYPEFELGKVVKL